MRRRPDDRFGELGHAVLDRCGERAEIGSLVKTLTQMLDLGVEIYELSSSLVKRNKRLNLFGASLGRLHAKLAVVDRETIFVGSMNLDPRSATINTELGAVITSAELARELIRVIDIDRLQNAYRVRRSADGKGLEWVSQADGRETVLDEEPDSSFWLRLKLRILSPIIPESLL